MKEAGSIEISYEEKKNVVGAKDMSFSISVEMEQN